MTRYFIAIDDPSSVGAARREAAELAETLGFDATDTGKLAIVVTEAASNIVKHAGRGNVVLRVLQANAAKSTRPGAGIEVLALDGGPGIADVGRSLRDGHSTAGSPGTGMGAMQRHTEKFELYSQPGKGTVVRFEVWPRDPPAHLPSRSPLSSRDKPLLPLVHGAITVPMPGETQCGDDWVMFPSGGGQALLVVDGLGHGAEAAVAARAAIASAVQSGHLGAEGIIDAVHRALRPTRGAAAAVAVLESDKQMCTFCGIGNIAAIIRVAGKSRSMVSHNGILGHQVRKIESFDYPFPRGALCVAHSDGLATRWDLDTYPGLEARHPSILAAVLFRDNSRGRDDSTVVAVRAGASP